MFDTQAAVSACNILAYTVRFKEKLTREPNFSSSLKRVSRDHSLISSLKEKVSREIVVSIHLYESWYSVVPNKVMYKTL